MVPDQFATVWEQVEQRIKVGTFVGRLIRVGLRALETALEGIRRLLRAEFLAAARDKVHAVWEEAGRDDLARGLVDGMLGVPRITAQVEDALRGDHLDPGRLDTATDRLKVLDRQFARLMGTAQGIVVSLGLILTLAPWLPPLVPHLALGIAAGYVAVTAASVVLGADYADSGTGLGLVLGVEGTVRKAME